MMKMEYDTNSNYLAAFYQDSDNGKPPTFTELFLNNPQFSESNFDEEIQKSPISSDLIQLKKESSPPQTVENNRVPTKKIKKIENPPKTNKKELNSKRNVLKNIGNQIVAYLLKIEKPFYTQGNFSFSTKEQRQIKNYLQKWVNRINKIEDLKTIWLGNDRVLKQNQHSFIRAGSRRYLKQEFIQKIFSSKKLKATEIHIQARNLILKNLHDVYNFTSLQ